MTKPIQICRGFTDEQWKGLRERLDSNDESAWNCAVEVFERRMRERFLAGIEALADSDSKSDREVPHGAPPDCSTLPEDGGNRVVVPGFAIMALCCLLIDTLQSFREKHEGTTGETVVPCLYPSGPCIRPAASTTEQFKRFLSLPAFRGEFDDDKIATQFVRGVRNGILHEAETRGWVIWRKEPPGRIVERHAEGYALNRTEFYRALKGEFENYLRELRDPGNARQRARFVKKMNDVAKEC